jgi:pimeloyl-ACP methyl ester carboxylesterase
VLREETASFADLPLVVLTATSASERRLRADTALAARSSQSRHVLVPDSGHWVPLDAPESVAQVIVDVVRSLRSS